MNTLFRKDPASVLDYTADWAAWLAGDSIVTSTWTVPVELAVVDQTSGPTSATVWLSGGQVGGTHTVTSRIVTAAGRTDERSFRIHIEQQ